MLAKLGRLGFLITLALLMKSAAIAGPPYVTDDPEPTEYQHYEIYAFTAGTKTADGIGAAAGIDFNYGGAQNLQLTVVVPAAYSGPNIGPSVTGFGDIELAAKYKFLHHEEFGLDVAIFPRLFLPTNSDPALGSKHAALFIPLFAQIGSGNWSIFGGGGCTINRGDKSRDFCQMGLVVTYRIVPELQLGVEVRHRTPDEEGVKPSTGLGFGAIYDLGARYHLMAWVGHGIQNANSTDQVSWYAALQFTY
jgi:hypothetical protein